MYLSTNILVPIMHVKDAKLHFRDKAYAIEHCEECTQAHEEPDKVLPKQDGIFTLVYQNSRKNTDIGLKYIW